jgi:hypothetical protein
MSWFTQIFQSQKHTVTRATSSPQQDAARKPLEARHAEMEEAIDVAWQAHQSELQQALTPERRRESFVIWRQAIDTEAHDYADLFIGRPERQRILKLEVEAIMQAYLFGYMARQGWIEESMALQSAYVLGRSLRDQIRALGVSLDSLQATLGTVMADALTEIIRQGMKQNE